tara:strand:+ start:2147 stop:3088 length:942 start_codon:yes stop_codon:yes gene_type:complete
MSSSVKVVDSHSHISQVEIQDIENLSDYNKGLKYGMGDKDNLYLMDELGIDIQVLHCSGHLGKYHKRVLKENPGRFAAIGKIDHRLLPHEEGLEKLKAQIDDFGFHGIYYDPWHPDVRKSQGFDPSEWGSPDPFFHFDDKRYDPQWKLIEELNVPVAMTVYADNLEFICTKVLNVTDKFPNLVVVLMHGLAPPLTPPNFTSSPILDSQGNVTLPEGAAELVIRNVYHEILPGLDGLRFHKLNRYGENDQVIKVFFDTFGPDKIMWGSEFTAVELPTLKQYKYQFDYIKDRCGYMTESDLEMIMGGTACKAYNL